MSTFAPLQRKSKHSNDVVAALAATSNQVYANMGRRRSRAVTPEGTSLDWVARTLGSAEPSHSMSHSVARLPIQLKLEVSEPGDAFEQEADRVAESVMRMPIDDAVPERPLRANTIALPSVGLVQRACSSCTDEEGRVQRTTIDAPEPRQSILGSHWYQRFHGAQSSGGEPLQHGIRQILEPRFGASFSAVRVHRDETADTLSREVSARAFTVGRHVFFKRGEFAPGTESGRRLIAHELAHVIQQRAAVKLQRQAEPPATQRAEPDLAASRPQTLKSAKFAGNEVLEMTLNNLITLKNGKETPSINRAVQLVQEALVRFGYALPRYGADGRFGNETEGAVALYQQDNTLKVDGRIGPETLGDLDDKLAAGAKPNIPPQPACFTLPDSSSSTLLAELQQTGYSVQTSGSSVAAADAEPQPKVPGRLVCWPYKYGVNVQECGANQGVIDQAHKDAAKLANSAINAIGHRMDADSNVPFALKEYFGKDALSFIPQIETRYYRVLFALGQSYMYHCAYADEKRQQMYLGKCRTGVWAETSQDDPHDISVCVPNFVDKCDDFVRAAVIIHESIHRLGMFDEGQGHAKRFRSGCAFEGSVAGAETRGYLWNCDSYAAFALWSSRSGY